MEQALPGRAHAAAAPQARHVAAAGTLVVPIFAAAMFLSGFLLFMVEPMAARMVLPILGGVPMVWNGCVVFFQIVMLAGYGYAFGTSRWVPLRRHVLVHGVLLLVPAAVLPFAIGSGTSAPPDGNPLAWLLLLLSATIGLPFFVLSTSASVFQHWLSRTDHPSARDPYFLYSASNLGCLLALASYPTVVEPVLTLHAQARLWAFGYAGFVALAAGCGAVAWWRMAPHAIAQRVEEPVRAAPPLSWPRRARWMALAFVPSSLMLAVTSYVSTDIAAVPLLWIVPLSLYLLTFSLAFGKRGAAADAIAARAVPLLVVPLALVMIAKLRAPLTAILLIHLGAFAAIALSCHASLAKDRPEASRLTEFYFWISFGGMLGGLFNTLAAPVLFNSIVEYPLVVAAACLLFRTREAAAWKGSAADVVLPLAVGGLTAGILIVGASKGAPLAVQLAALSLPAILTFAQRREAHRFGWCVAALMAASLAFDNAGERVLYATRTFFGVYRVSEDLQGRYHALAHGTTLHGLQALAPERRNEALTYFHRTGPFGQAWAALPRAARARDVAVVGLGVGTLASYATPAQRWTFFEIDPAIERIARTREQFTFLEACGARCPVVIGDARISLNRVPERSYDVLVLDAFSSDSIPIHLMTREAVALYLSRLVPDGLLVMHISNRHLTLGPIVARLAESHGLTALQQIDRGGARKPEGKSDSHWIVMARNPADLAPLAADPRWSPLTPRPGTPLWTDDFSNILSVLHAR
ncbi:MAG TPA: fused MFS/spermidine synthase [Vicinamibacterales bacterium]|nr:fused MFS/spermidine synthase [Vicinamibacterales bacterium]